MLHPGLGLAIAVPSLQSDGLLGPEKLLQKCNKILQQQLWSPVVCAGSLEHSRPNAQPSALHVLTY
jgi:hypothetical protein